MNYATSRRGLSIRGASHSRRQKVRRRSSATSRVSHVAEGVRPTTPKWLWPVVLAVLFIGALLWFSNRNTSSVNTVNTAATASSNTAAQASNAASNAAGSLGAFVKAAIPGGVDLNIPENGMENRLLVYIKDPHAKVSRETWFEFDRLNLDTGLANLQLSSQEEQLENIAKILKAYPNVHVRIDSYTDNQGDAAANLKLSQDRANAVMAHLIALSVDPFRIDAKGYGEDQPVADNSTEEGRARNRRIALRVTQK